MSSCSATDDQGASVACTGQKGCCGAFSAARLLEKGASPFAAPSEEERQRRIAAFRARMVNGQDASSIGAPSFPAGPAKG